MVIARLAAVSDYLLRLYACSVEADASRFSTVALDGLRELLDADKAWWGTISISESGPNLLSSFHCGLPDTWETTWEAVKHDDSVARNIATTNNRAFIMDSATIPAASRLLELAERFDVRQTLSISVDLPDQNAFMFLSLYRGRGRPPFTPEDGSINQFLIPHIRAAWRQNLRERLRVRGDSSGDETYKAFVDRAGRLVQHEEGFAAIVGQNWPAWRGPQLPLFLREAIERVRIVPGRWIGRSRWTLRAAPAGMLTLVDLRETSPLDRLRPRELQAVKLFAEGATHKDIALLTGLAPSTVRHYLRESYSKLNINNKAALANLVSRRRPAAGP